jgi:hypothetical protein
MGIVYLAGHDKDRWQMCVVHDNHVHGTCCRSRVNKGVLAVPLPFRDFLGDPCAGTNKRLVINYTDKAGICRVCEWDDGDTPVLDYMQAIRATYSPQVELLPLNDNSQLLLLLITSPPPSYVGCKN